jgi:membrane protein YdbS with pleckstrin-like domain
LVLSVGLAFGAQLIKPLVGRVCEWDHGAAQALAALPIIVILFLMPYRWTSASSVEPRRGEADRPMESDY